MFSETPGKSTVRNSKISKTMLLVPIAILFWGLSCGSKSDKGNVSAVDTSLAKDTVAMTVDDTIESVMNEAMQRLRYREKSYLYEMEFAYYRDKFDFDHYLAEGKIRTAQADTLQYVDVVNVSYFAHDSARAEVAVHFKGPSGLETIFKDKNVMLYWHEGHWIKPTLSNPLAQKQYDEIREKALEAVKKESGGSNK